MQRTLALTLATLALCLSAIAKDVVKDPVILEAVVVPVISKDVVKILPARNLTRLGNITVIADIDEKTVKITWKEGEAIPLTTDMAIILPDGKKLTLAAGTIIQIRGADVLQALIAALKTANALQ